MTKEDEMQALKTLHTVSPLPSVLNLGDLEKLDTQGNSVLVTNTVLNTNQIF